MSTYNENLQQNNSELAKILAMAEDLPAAGPGGISGGASFDETIELTETTGIIELTEMNGKPLNLVECIVLIDVNHDEQGSNSVNGLLRINGITSGQLTLHDLGLKSGQTYDRPAMVYLKYINANVVYGIRYQINSTADITNDIPHNTNSAMASVATKFVSDANTINKVLLAGHGTISFGAGTKVRIIGRQGNA